MQSSKQIFSTTKEALEKSYPALEADALTYRLMEGLLKIKKTDVILDAPLENEIPDEWNKAIERLHSFEPIQHILGKTEFMDSTFQVTKHTLIPRPETEELVQRIIDENKAEKLSVLDIGTGSGCIAVSLAKHLKESTVSAIDLSGAALATAKKNSKKNRVYVHFHQLDVFSFLPFDKQSFDIIVSNPPYVRESEKKEMEKNVLDYEPHKALFVSDEKALIFYERILVIAKVLLKSKGKVYFEINEALGKEMKELADSMKVYEYEIHQDLYGKDRFMILSFR